MPDLDWLTAWIGGGNLDRPLTIAAAVIGCLWFAWLAWRAPDREIDPEAAARAWRGER